MDRSTEIIIQNFEIEPPAEEPSDEDLLRLLADQIAYMIEYRMEYLLSLLYRNDVEESKINFALSPHCKEPANIALAKLVLDRQKERLATKKAYKIDPIDDIEEDLKF